MPKGRTLLLVGLAGLLSCTADPGPQPTPEPSSSAGSVAIDSLPSALATPGESAPVPNAERQQPLRGMGACQDPPSQGHDEEVPGLILPPGAILTEVTPVDPLTNTTGYVTMTPVQVRAFYQQHPAVTIISVEDESFEAEILYEADDRRVFLKAQAVCELGSIFVAVVSPAP